MKTVQIKDKHFVPYISNQEIHDALQQLATAINRDMAEKCPVFLGVLNGCFRVMGDLMQYINIPCEVSFVKLASYEGMQTTGTIRNLIGLSQSLENRHIVIVEDIIDSGITIDYTIRLLQEMGVASVRVATLLLKPEALKRDIKADYTAFRIPNGFVVGYGLDYDGLGRELNDIYTLKQ